MKKHLLIILALVFTFKSLLLWGAVTEVTLETKKIKDAVHWIPEIIEVTQGDQLKIIAKHELEGGFDFHGLFIPVLKISKQVNRHKLTKVEVTIPADLKPGEYPIGCQFHPKHVAAKLIVKAAEKPDPTNK